MTSFECDYDNGMLPEILQRLMDTNSEHTSGYGFDPYTDSAKKKIREACGIKDADVVFLVGGTQTNSVVIDSLLWGYEGVICADTGHIGVHEAGAIEAFGHKVLPIGGNNGKISAEDIDGYMSAFLADDTYIHQVQPGMVYITFPTELGGLYSKQEIADIYAVARRYDLKLFIDGARLGYGLMSHECDVDLKFIAGHCDVFYIGGTKVGAQFGEAVVYTGTRAPKNIFTIVKRHGALLAKGRMLGIQFDTLFTDDLYLRISKHSIDMAAKLKAVFLKHGYKMMFGSPTNQQFVLMPNDKAKKLAESVKFEKWEPEDENNSVFRFVTSWATTDEDINSLDSAL
jgi:threonine aldolase